MCSEIVEKVQDMLINKVVVEQYVWYGLLYIKKKKTMYFYMFMHL